MGRLEAVQKAVDAVNAALARALERLRRAQAARS